jgi:hypothetical protein
MNRIFGIDKLAGPHVGETGPGLGELFYTKYIAIGIENIKSSGIWEIVSLALVGLAPILFFISTRYKWKVVFLVMFAIAIFGIVIFVRSFFGPAFTSFVYGVFNL